MLYLKRKMEKRIIKWFSHQDKTRNSKWSQKLFRFRQKKNFPPHIFDNGKYTVLTKCFSRWSGWQRKIQSGAKMMFSVPIMTMSQKKPMDAIMGPEIAGPLQSSEYSHIRKILNMQNRHTLYKHVYLVFLKANRFNWLILLRLATRLLRNILVDSQSSLSCRSM